jgi:cytoskeletal protein CcmA (bactofilin family)
MVQPAGIGESIHIKGELTGNEDLIVDGHVEGKISLEGHALTIGASAKVSADIRSKAVVVHGQVVGNITAADRIEITPSGSVQGDLRAQRVALADGATFKGTIDMKPAPSPERVAATARPD